MRILPPPTSGGMNECIDRMNFKWRHTFWGRAVIKDLLVFTLEGEVIKDSGMHSSELREILYAFLRKAVERHVFAKLLQTELTKAFTGSCG